MKSLRTILRQIPLVVSTALFVRGLARLVPNLLRYGSALWAFRRSSNASRPFVWKWRSLYPCLGDDTDSTGFDRHYTFHTAWAARAVAAIRPSVHHDISSAIYFSTLVSAFVPVRFYDFRPAALHLSNLFCGQADLVKLPFESESIDSLSCMHVVEHVGLGRYGDPINPEGDLVAIQELQRVVRPGGHLLFVTPIGGQAQIQFNAHRIYTADMIRAYFKDRFELKEFALIPEKAIDGDLVINPDTALLARQYYACGCFWFVKKGTA